MQQNIRKKKVQNKTAITMKEDGTFQLWQQIKTME